jgi:putative phosphoesterase
LAKNTFILNFFCLFFKGRNLILRNSLILVISDSHGNIPALVSALNWAQSIGAGTAPFYAAIFLGDGTDDLDHASAEAGFTAPWYKVRGNGDMNFSIPDTLILEIPGNPARKLFLSHGNRHNVDGGGQAIAAAAKAAGAEAAFFGHTHVPYCSMINGIFVLNPGSIGRSRTNAGPTFAVLDCPANGPLSARFFCLAYKGRKIDVRELEF